MSNGNDVFISYSSKDLAFAQSIKDELKLNGIESYLHYHDASPGLWEKEINDNIELCQFIVLIIGGDELSRGQLTELNHAEEFWRKQLDDMIIPIKSPELKDKEFPGRVLRYQIYDKAIAIKHILEEIKIPLDFSNREGEIKEINLESLESENTYWNFMLINSPPRYGKSHLLKYLYVQTKKQKQLCAKWSSYYLNFKAFSDPVKYVFQEICGKEEKYTDDADAKIKLKKSILASLSLDSQNEIKGILIFVDTVENLGEYGLKFVSEFLVDIVVSSYKDDLQESKYPVRIFIAGRDTKTIWDGILSLGSDGLRSQAEIALSDFGSLAIETLISKKSKIKHLDLTRSQVINLAGEILFFGCGHPDILSEIINDVLDEIKDKGFGGLDFEKNRKGLVEHYISTRVDEISTDIIKKYSKNTYDVLRLLSCFRLVDLKTIRTLIEEGKLPNDIEPVDEYAKLQKAFYLPKRKENEAFNRDPSQRRVLALDMQYGRGKNVTLFHQIHEIAKKIFRTWVESKKVQESAVTEWFYHSVYLCGDVNEIKKDEFQSLISLIEVEDPITTPANMIVDSITNDTEIKYLFSQKSNNADLKAFLLKLVEQ